MNKNFPIPVPPGRATSPGRSARERVGSRTRELAVLAGRPPVDVTQADYESAKREITGETQSEKQDLFLDAVLRD